MNPLSIMNECEKPMQCESPSVVDTLKRRQKSLQSQLNDVEAALKALDENPNVMIVLELLAKCR